ncbi:MAG: hypothetical protein K2N89_01390, partial [Lachnospiraceae bacterium]|nr:hypothetical protein [Lachnospiraceae bacterium]
AKGKYTGTVTAPEELDEDETVKTPAETRTMTVEGIGNYTGKRKITIKVVDKLSAKQLAVEIDKNFKPVYGDGTDYDYLFSDKMKTENGQEVVDVARKIKVVDKKSKTTVLTEGDDFVVVYNNVAYDDEGNFAAGTVKFTVVGIGKYSGNVSKSFKISPKMLVGVEAGLWDEDANGDEVFKTSGLELKYNPAGATFENSEEELLVRYSYKYTENGTEKTDYNYLEEGYDYTISYSGNKKVGTAAKAKINFIGDYKGTKALVVPFTITGATLTDWAEAYVADMTYATAGKSYVSKPIVVAYYNTDTILKASEYQVSYEWSSASDVTKDEATGNETRNWTPDDKVKITLKEGDSYALVRATIKPSAKSNFVLEKDTQTVDGKEIEVEVPIVVEYHVRKADTGALDLSKAKVEFYSDPACTKQIKAAQFCKAGIFTPAGNNAGNIGQYDDPDAAVYVKVIVNKAPVDANLYDVTWLCNYDAGKATVIITGKGPSESNNASSGTGTQADDGPTTTTTAYAVGGKTVSVKINPLKTWIIPTPVTETVTNFLNELF